MKIGYSFWGFLSDIKLDKNYNLMSTPDGNAYYSWAIISEFQKNNYDIIAIYPNRDKYAYSKYGAECFASWGKDIKNKSYLNTSYLNYPDTNLSELTENDIYIASPNKIGITGNDKYEDILCASKSLNIDHFLNIEELLEEEKQLRR